MHKFIAPALAALALAGTATPAVAEEERTIVISYADLNLLNPAGLERLERRIRLAVRQVCGMADPGSQFATDLPNNCRKQARLGVNPQIAQAIDRQRTNGGALMLAVRPGG